MSYGLTAENIVWNVPEMQVYEFLQEHTFDEVSALYPLPPILAQSSVNDVMGYLQDQAVCGLFDPAVLFKLPKSIRMTQQQFNDLTMGYFDGVETQLSLGYPFQIYSFEVRNNGGKTIFTQDGMWYE